jgi:hypothetical protein
MFISGWLHHIAVRGCLIAALVFPSALIAQAQDKPGAGTEQQQPKADQNKSNQARTLSVTQEPNAAEIANPSEIAQNNQTKAAKYRSPCGDTDDDRQADLCEQQKMARRKPPPTTRSCN